MKTKTWIKSEKKQTRKPVAGVGAPLYTALYLHASDAPYQKISPSLEAAGYHKLGARAEEHYGPMSGLGR